MVVYLLRDCHFTCLGVDDDETKSQLKTKKLLPLKINESGFICALPQAIFTISAMANCTVK
jgi:hypothetical protein